MGVASVYTLADRRQENFMQLHRSLGVERSSSAISVDNCVRHVVVDVGVLVRRHNVMHNDAEIGTGFSYATGLQEQADRCAQSPRWMLFSVLSFGNWQKLQSILFGRIWSSDPSW